jgi:hypothetical protein
MPSTDDEPSRRRPGWPLGRGHQHGSHVHHRFPRQGRRPAMPQRPSTSTPQTFPVTTRPVSLHCARAPRRRTRSTSGFAAAQPTSARFELVVSLEGLHNAGFSRTPFRLASQAQAVWQYRPVPSLSGLLPPSPASPGSGCPQLQPARCDSPAVKVSHPHSNPRRLVAHLIDKPALTDRVAGRTCSVDELWRERLYPPVHRDMVDVDTALSDKSPRPLRDHRRRAPARSSPRRVPRPRSIPLIGAKCRRIRTWHAPPAATQQRLPTCSPPIPCQASPSTSTSEQS